MDFIQGNEIVKIDPHAIDICGNNHITLGTELITLDNKKIKWWNNKSRSRIY